MTSGETAGLPGGDACRIARRLWRYSLAIRIAVWLCWLPISLRLQRLDTLLRRAGRTPTLRPLPDTGMDEVVCVTRRVCRVPLFRQRVFPRACLCESLALFYVLTRFGYPARFHIGVCKTGHQLWGHSWITCHGRPVVRGDGELLFRTLYSYPMCRTDVDGEMATSPPRSQGDCCEQPRTEEARTPSRHSGAARRPIQGAVVRAEADVRRAGAEKTR